MMKFTFPDGRAITDTRIDWQATPCGIDWGCDEHGDYNGHGRWVDVAMPVFGETIRREHMAEEIEAE